MFGEIRVAPLQEVDVRQLPKVVHLEQADELDT